MATLRNQARSKGALMASGVVVLGDRRVIEVAGEEADTFLQRLVTNDVETLAAGQARYAALLTPQGKIVTDFFVVRSGQRLLLDVPAATAADLARKLTMYRLRAKVAVADLSDTLGVVAFPAEPPERAVETYDDPRDPALWRRAIVPRPLQADEAGQAAYHAQRIMAGVPESGLDFAFGDTFPHEANLDRLHGVDFRKGCYVGQEVVSRVEHRGTARKRVVAFAFDGAPPPPGSDIVAGDAVIGTFGSAIAGHGLGLVRLDRLDEAVAAAQPVAAGGVALRAPFTG